jgi:hypothetical protein
MRIGSFCERGSHDRPLRAPHRDLERPLVEIENRTAFLIRDGDEDLALLALGGRAGGHRQRGTDERDDSEARCHGSRPPV